MRRFVVLGYVIVAEKARGANGLGDPRTAMELGRMRQNATDCDTFEVRAAVVCLRIGTVGVAGPPGIPGTGGAPVAHGASHVV